MNLENKVAVVTGGAMGNGLGIVKVFLKEGVKVAILDYSDELEKTLKTLKGEVYGYKVDIREKKAVEKVIEDVKSKLGNIDILVNNAGIAIDTLVESKTKDNFIKTLEVNTIAPFFLMKKIVIVL